MQRPRIEVAEVVSFRLTLPRSALEQAVDDLTHELRLCLDPDGTDLVLSQADGDCALRFARLDGDLALTEVLICNDEDGAFFARVLVRLVSDHEGDLEIRLVWNAARRNTEGTHATVSFRRGRPTPPKGTSAPVNALRNAVLSGGEPVAELAPAAPAADEVAASAGEEEEIRKLLARARTDWANYQRLKAQREGRSA